MTLQTTIQGSPSKTTSLETFAMKLADKIIHAHSPLAVERYIAVAVKALGNRKLNGYIIQRFIDRVTLYLDSHAPTAAQQADNSKIARKRLKKFRKGIAFPADIQ